MTPTEVRQAVLDELGSDRERGKIHRVDLHRSLVDPPRRRTYLDSFNANAPLELWLVLEEDPDKHAGYEIVFDETRGSFGLATPGLANDAPVFIGWHGTLLDALEGM